MANPLREVLARHVDAGTIPGAIATYGRECDPLLVGSAGTGGGALKADAIVRIQSMTKLVTTVAALRLVEQGAIALDDGIESWMPELADRRVLAHPMADVDDTVPAQRPISLRDLLTNQSGYGVVTVDSPLLRAMVDAGLDANNEPVDRGAQEWLAALAALPLAHQPGQGWRYHLGFGILGILLGRVAGTSTSELLRHSVLGPVGMPDTGFRVPEGQEHRLLAAYRRTPEGLVEAEPAGGGFHTGPAPFDESHSELVSTLADYHAFLRALVDGDLVGPALLDELRTDQVDAAAKTPESFFPGFWDGLGWGFGVSVTTAGPHRGRFGWSGGYGTDFFVDPDGTICVVLAQVEMDEQVLAMIGEVLEAVD
ncbi:serine hydrolase domain-containing protein [Myceligenerans salitolerans]|uniref:Beta-lactamase family protein n=1 Tax=Myceligenerans salitolerans TaxID=1230528 RepID=A0ABS3I3L3_9MICO|nr:serine hydrolase domain-containing protein [Myceligenerans salitolerans]MBO0607578.1 beta-lactamase family protein [Myceligenerans salitolerans]